jgi:hypothetical protein
MEQASLYKFLKTGKYLIHSVSRVEMGGGIATPPFIHLDEITSIIEVTKQLIFAMSMSRTNLPTPASWRQFNIEFLEAIDLKKNTELYTNSINVSVLKLGEFMIFRPTINTGSKGFINLKDEEQKIKCNSEIHEISKVLELTMSRSKIK